MKPDLSVVVPTYNEEKNIAGTIATIEKYFAEHKITGEIIISDDYSSDETVAKVRGLLPKYKNLKILTSYQNYHKGWPVKTGMLTATGKYILFSDADLATPITEVNKLLAAIDRGADLAIGSRIQPGGVDLRRSQPQYRRLLGKIFTKLTNLLIADIVDSQCGFKLFKSNVARELFSRQKIKNIVFDVEILFLARKLGYKISQVPVNWQYAGETRMRVNLKNAVLILSSLAKVWLWHH